MFLKIDGTFVVQLVNFAIFFALLLAVFLRPVGRGIAERRKYINSVMHDYERYQMEAAQLRAQAEAARAAARREAEQLVAKARADATNESARLSAGFMEQAAHAVQAAQAQVAQELAQARSGDEKRAAELADLIVQRAVPEIAA